MGKKIGKSVLKYQPPRPRAPTQKELVETELMRLREEEKARQMEEKIEKEREKIPEEPVPAELPHETKLGEIGWDRDKEKTKETTAEEETTESKELKSKLKTVLLPEETKERS